MSSGTVFEDLISGDITIEYGQFCKILPDDLRL